MAGCRLVIIVVLALASLARANAIVYLEPRTEGPYDPGEAVVLDVLVENTDSIPRYLRGVQWDFGQTDPSISLGATFTWNLDPPFGGFAYDVLPVPNWASTALDYSDPSLLFILPPAGALNVGSLEVFVDDSGWVDAFNSDWQHNINRGARITYGFGGPEDPIVEWFSYERDDNPPELTGGRVFLAVPEPTSMVLLGLGAIAVCRRRR